MSNTSLALEIVLASYSLPAAHSCCDVDGDVNFTIAVPLYLIEYLVTCGPAPANFDTEDFDARELMTISDATALIGSFFACDFFIPPCPPDYPPLVPQIDSSARILYTDRIPAGATSAAISLTLASTGSYQGMLLPVRIRVDGQIPTIDSVIFPLEGSTFRDELTRQAIDVDSGLVVLGGVDLWSVEQVERFAKLFVTVPSAPQSQPVTLAWVILSPDQAPTPDSTIFPMVTYSCGGGIEPVLAPHCCVTPGDADNSGAGNIADVTYLVSFQLLGGPPSSCADEADANGDNDVNIADVTYLVTYLFTAGPAPICGTTGT